MCIIDENLLSIEEKANKNDLNNYIGSFKKFSNFFIEQANKKPSKPNPILIGKDSYDFISNKLIKDKSI